MKLRCEQLESRENPSSSAIFLTDTLYVSGDSSSNNLQVFADASGSIQVTDNGSPVSVFAPFGKAIKSNLKSIVVDAGSGSDTIGLARSLNTLDANNKLSFAPNAHLLGGNGNDTIIPLIGGFVGGIVGNSIVGNIVQDGGSGNDSLTSGFGNDLMIGGNGDDTLIWLPGQLLDIYEGGSGHDNAIIVGNDNNQGDNFVLSKHPTVAGRVLFQRTNLVPFSVDIDDCEVVTLRTQSGNDSVSILSLLGTDVKNVSIDLGSGDDIYMGKDFFGGQRVFGGDGNDSILTGTGNDIIDAGNGDDRIVSLSGNDSIKGGLGADTFVNISPRDRLIDFNPDEGDLLI